jgi:hypothetical protein
VSCHQPPLTPQAHEDMSGQPNSPVTKSLLTRFVQSILWILERFFGHVRSSFSQLLSLGAPDLSGAQDRILVTFSRRVRFPTGHVRVTDTPTGRFPMGAINGCLHPRHSFGHSADLKNCQHKLLKLKHTLSSFNQIQSF